MVRKPPVSELTYSCAYELDMRSWPAVAWLRKSPWAFSRTAKSVTIVTHPDR